MEQKSFIMYHDMWEQLSELTDEEIGRITRATFLYHSTGELIDIGRLCNIVFKNIKTMLDRDRIKYDEYIVKQSENGKLGGRPNKSDTNPTKAKKPTAFSENPTKAKKADSASVIPSVSDSSSDIDNIETYISKEIGEQALEVIEHGNKEINDLLEIVKDQVEFLGLIYKKGKYERERAKNIITGKDFGDICEKSNMSRREFCKQIIFMSSKLDFWNGKINNAETLYKHYAQVYNEAVNLKAKKQKDTSLIVF